MTYTEAAKHNNAMQVVPTFMAPKAWQDGSTLRWIKDPEGCIGYVHKASTPGILIHYPVQVLAQVVRISVRSWPHEMWTQMERLP